MTLTFKLRKWYYILIILFSAVLIFLACKKIDKNPDLKQQDDIVHKFFNQNRSSEVLESKIVDYLKRKNSYQHFIDKTVQQIGFPQWNKLISFGNQTGANFKGSIISDSLTVVFIPFVRENQHVVNACLQIVMTANDTTGRYICDWQYHDTTASHLTARQQSLILMLLNKKVFGNNIYKIIDTAAFGSDNLQRPIRYVKFDNLAFQVTNGKQLTNSKSNSAILVTIIICHTTSVEVNNGQIGSGCPPDGPCPLYYDQKVCESFSSWSLIDDDDDWDFGWDSGGGDSGGGGDDGTPPVCNGSATRSNNVINPCSPGWIPVDDGPTENLTPCEKANILRNDSVSISKFKQLQSLVNSNHEEAFAMPQSANGIIQHFIGTSGNRKVESTITSMIRNHLHNHYNDINELSVFSPDDFEGMALLFSGNKINTNNFTMGVTTSFGTNYVMVIDDPNAFRGFINNYVYDDNNNENLSNLFTRYGIHHSSSVAANELGMLQLFKDKGAGIKMLKADSNFTKFEELILNRDANKVIPVSCN